MKKWAK